LPTFITTFYIFKFVEYKKQFFNSLISIYLCVSYNWLLAKIAETTLNLILELGDAEYVLPLNLTDVYLTV
jgi:hypothetical protein